MSKVLELTYADVGLAKEFYPDDDVELFNPLLDPTHLPFDDGEFKGIFAHYILNRISWRETIASIVEWSRCLEVDGLLHIIVPSRRWIARQMLQEAIEPHVAPLLFGELNNEWEVGRSTHSVSDLRAMIDAADLAITKAKVGTVQMELADKTYQAEQIYVVGRKDAYLMDTHEFV